MPEISRRKLLGVAAAFPLASLWVGEAGAGTEFGPTTKGENKARTPWRFDAISPRKRLQELHFPNVVLRTQDNKEVRFYDDLIKGKIVTLNYFYTKCTETCPLTTEHLVQAQRILGKRVGREIFMYSLSLDPVHDTPEVLRKYMKIHGVGPGWTFLTGKFDNLELLRHKLGFVDPDPKVDKDRANHIGSILCGNEPLMLWSCCPSLLTPMWIVRHIAWVAQLKDLHVKKV